MQRETPLQDKPGMKIQWKGVLYYIITCSDQPPTYMVIYDIKVSPKIHNFKFSPVNHQKPNQHSEHRCLFLLLFIINIKLVQLHYEQNTILALDCDIWSGCFSDFTAICMAPLKTLKLLNRFWKIKWFWEAWNHFRFDWFYAECPSFSFLTNYNCVLGFTGIPCFSLNRHSCRIIAEWGTKRWATLKNLTWSIQYFDISRMSDPELHTEHTELPVCLFKDFSSDFSVADKYLMTQ